MRAPSTRRIRTSDLHRPAAHAGDIGRRPDRQSSHWLAGPDDRLRRRRADFRCSVLRAIPLIVALDVMALVALATACSSAPPVIDPSMFALTAGVLGWEFAIAKTMAAIGISALFGGYVTLALTRGGAFAEPLREGVGNGGCGARSVRDPKPVAWAFWREDVRRARFVRESLKTSLFLFKWLTLAFILESLMIAFVPPEWVATAVGGDGVGSIAIATVVGVPAYLNGYAALPLVSGLVEQGMAPGAGLAFLVAGGVTSLPAAIAVWALARRPVFALYIALALTGSLRQRPAVPGLERGMSGATGDTGVAPFGHVLAWVDGSGISCRAAERAAQLARSLGAKPELHRDRHAAQERQGIRGRRRGSRASRTRCRSRCRATRTPVSHVAPGIAARLGMPVAGRVVCSGNPTAALCDVARTQGADLVVLGQHPPGPVGWLLGGSTADRVSKGCGFAVLSIG